MVEFWNHAGSALPLREGKGTAWEVDKENPVWSISQKLKEEER